MWEAGREEVSSPFFSYYHHCTLVSLQRDHWGSIKSAHILLFPLEGQKEKGLVPCGLFLSCRSSGSCGSVWSCLVNLCSWEADWAHGVDEADLKSLEKQLNLPVTCCSNMSQVVCWFWTEVLFCKRCWAVWFGFFFVLCGFLLLFWGLVVCLFVCFWYLVKEKGYKVRAYGTEKWTVSVQQVGGEL